VLCFNVLRTSAAHRSINCAALDAVAACGALLARFTCLPTPDTRNASSVALIAAKRANSTSTTAHSSRSIDICSRVAAHRAADVSSGALPPHNCALSSLSSGSVVYGTESDDDDDEDDDDDDSDREATAGRFLPRARAAELLCRRRFVDDAAAAALTAAVSVELSAEDEEEDEEELLKSSSAMTRYPNCSPCRAKRVFSRAASRNASRKVFDCARASRDQSRW
jgi:hypothetical protein